LRSSPEKSAAWLDRWHSRWLTAVERELFFRINGDQCMDYPRRWGRAARMIVLALAVAGFLPATVATWIVVVAGLISLACFSFGTNGHGQQPWYALFPVRLIDLARIRAKTGLFHLVLWWPLPMLAGAFLAWKWNASPTMGLVFGAKAVVVFLALLPVAIVAHFSPQTNDSAARHCAVRFVLAAIATFLGTLAGVLVLLFAPWPGAAAGAVVALGFPWWFLWCYGRWFNRMRFDLMPTIR
jgi:hypothetical protein